MNTAEEYRAASTELYDQTMFELDVAEVRQQFAFASEFHTNFYENWLDETEIRESSMHVRDFVENLSRG